MAEGKSELGLYTTLELLRAAYPTVVKESIK